MAGEGTPAREAEASPEQRAPSSRCPNCDALLAGRFCADCGQDQSHELRRPLRRFVGEVIEETVALDSRFAHTLGPLLFRPGRVAADMIAGRRARYSSPVRLYLVASLLFFLGSALAPDRGQHVRVELGETDGGRVAIRLGGSAPDTSTPDTSTDGSHAAGPVASAPAPDERDALEGLRRSGRLGAQLADRAERIRTLPPGEAERRFAAVFDAHLPTALFVLVPILAGLMKLAWRRRFFAEHLLLALHVQTVGFLALLPGAVGGWEPLTAAGVLAAVLWAWLALRRVHGEGAVRTTLKLAGVGAAHGICLALALSAVGLAAVLAL